MNKNSLYCRRIYDPMHESSLIKVNKVLKNLFWVRIVIVILTISIVTSCENFIDPEQELILKSDEMFKDWEEYRSAGLGLYALQQDLVEQLLILGELRGDLLKITENAPPELIDVQNFNIKKDNPYASPRNFYKLISACNKLIRQLESAYPEVLDKTKPINNYDRLYGEVLCMRAWAYFNAVRIYKKVPFIPETLTDVEEIEKYVNSESSYIVPYYINFAADGYYNDTIRDTTIVLNKQFLNQKAVIDIYTKQLENNIKATGVNHSIINRDATWSVTIWNEYARRALLGQMHLFDGNYTSAIGHFNPILFDNTSETSEIRYGLDKKFARNSWKNIFTGIEPYEHIFTLWFGKSGQQTHAIQTMFSILPPNEYFLKPTASAISYWESIWDNPIIQINNNNPELTILQNPGMPGDYYRGYGVSYKYYKYGMELSIDIVKDMLLKKLAGQDLAVQLIMQDVDTVCYKYSLGKNPFSHDANFVIFRAAGIHLYAAEIYALWVLNYSGLIRPATNTSLNYLNDGTYTTGARLGVRGRVGFADGYEAIRLNDIIYKHDPHTNKIVGYFNYTGNLAKKQEYLMDMIIEERARELAFEGERFYDLIRIAIRKNDPSYLAEKVSAKFDGFEKDAIYQKLMDENNWYIQYFD